MKEFYNQTGNTYPGSVFLNNGDKKTGTVAAPNYESPTVLFRSDNGRETNIPAGEINKIEIYNKHSPNQVFEIRFLPLKKNKNRWVIKLAEGQNLSAYIGGAGYQIKDNGSLTLGGYTQRIQTTANSWATIQPSFPVLMQKTNEPYLTMVGVHSGVSNEASALRAGLSRYLKDDPKLTDYLRKTKWGFDQVGDIVKSYNPNRGDEPLTINGIEAEPIAAKLLTSDFDNELIFSLDGVLPSDKNMGTQFGIGLRSTFHRFITAGATFGYASADYVDYVKYIENHPFNGYRTHQVIPEDFSKANMFNFRASGGVQLPFDLRSIYLIPSVDIGLGGMFCAEYQTFYYGPQGMIEIGFKGKYGSAYLIGVGYRYNSPLKSDEGKTEATYPGYDAYTSYGNLVFRVSYKF